MTARLASSCQGSGGRKSGRCGSNYNAAGIARALGRSAAVVVVAAAVACTNLAAAACLWTQAGGQAGRAPCMGACGFTYSARTSLPRPAAELWRRCRAGGQRWPALVGAEVCCVCLRCLSVGHTGTHTGTHTQGIQDMVSEYIVFKKASLDNT